MRKVVFLALNTTIDALEATEQVPATDLERLRDTLYALESLTYFQKTLAQVPISHLWPFLPSLQHSHAVDRPLRSLPTSSVRRLNRRLRIRRCMWRTDALR